jgi:hypothetical protein
MYPPADSDNPGNAAGDPTVVSISAPMELWSFMMFLSFHSAATEFGMTAADSASAPTKATATPAA